MALGVIATLKVNPGTEAALEAAFAKLAAEVRANEPGNRLYQLCKSKAEPPVYIVMEIYEDDAALKAHGASDHFKAAGPSLAPCMAGRPDLAFYDLV